MKKLTCVLLVDDNYAINLLHKKIMQNLGITAQFRIAKHGEDAINYLEQSFTKGGEGYPKPDLILMDINMPKMNGWEFQEEYRQRNYASHNIVFAVLTTSPNPDDEKKAMQLPEIAAYLQKPLYPKEMEAFLKKFFEI